VERNVLCKKNEILPGDKKVFQIRRTSIVLTRNEDGYFAMRNACPHQGAELSGGLLRGLACSSSEKEVCYEKQSSYLYCPWHHWSFDIETGRSAHDPSVKVKTYEIKIEDDDLVIYA
jgi:nitrite reductase (NADH) small subunit